MFVCNYPKLIAAYHVLHRLLVPRHPPYALIRFKYYDLIFIRVNVHQDFCFPYYFINTLRCDKKLLSQYVKELETRRFAVMSADSNRLMCTDCYIFCHYFCCLTYFHSLNLKKWRISESNR